MPQASATAPNRKRPQRRLVAILAADIVGYSRLMEADERRTLRGLMALRHELIDPAIAEYGGRLIKTTGDGFLVEYPSVVDAVTCAIAIQQGVAAVTPAGEETSEIVFRIGIHVGDILTEEGDIFGDGVNLAARIESLCVPGGVCVSAIVREQLHGKLPVALVDRGDQFVKNISRPIRVFDLPVEDVVRFALASSPSPLLLPAPPRRRPIAAVYVAIGIVCLALIAAGVIITLRQGAGVADAPTRPEPAKIVPVAVPGGPTSIAVLPFTSLGSDPDQAYFADGLVDNLTTDLSVGIPDLTVVARSSSFAYKDKAVDVRQVGRDLGVRYLLQGSLQRGDAGRLRISAQLIDTSAGAEVWADRFDGDRGDLLALQDQITARLANTLHVALVRAGARAGASVDPGAADLVLRGQAALVRPYSAASLDEAEANFRRALASDAHNVAAMSGLGRTLALRAVNIQGRTDGSLRPKLQEAEQLLNQAVSLEPRRPGVHSALGLVYRGLDRQADAAEQFRLEIAINKNAAGAYADLGSTLTYLGKPEQAIPLIEKSQDLDPRNPNSAIELAQLARAYFALGQYDKAVASLEKARAANPDLASVHYQLAAAYALAGDQPGAKRALADALRMEPSLTIGKLRLDRKSAEPYYLALFERIYAGLRRAGLRED